MALVPYRPLLLSVMALDFLGAATFKLDLQPADWSLAPGLVTSAWTYGGTVPGPMVKVAPGERVVIEGTNRLPVATNIHWHGLEIPNDQDGPARTIQPGASFRYEFTVPGPGTYWFHSHYRPVLEQVDRGLYGAFVIAAPEDAKYSGDDVLVLDDWYLDAQGKRLPGSASGMMERLGNHETVNGKTGKAIPALTWTAGELHKLRFVNASTAAVHTLSISGHRFRVTHLDGHPLSEPYDADSITLSPGERIDVEVTATGKPGETYEMFSGHPELGLVIPITYRPGSVAPVASPFIPPKPHGFEGIEKAGPDYTLELDSGMAGGMMSGGMMSGGMMGGGMMQGGMMGQGGMMPSASMMRWTINGASYPDTKPLVAKLGRVTKVRLVNKDTRMMHPMDHPIHLHGTAFQVVSINGRRPPREMWKDTYNVPAGGYVDIAFRYVNPGDWMLHCHILDHEDGGMMTVLKVQ